MRAMANSEKQPHQKNGTVANSAELYPLAAALAATNLRNAGHTAARLAKLYPLAFALAAASNSHTSLALQRVRLAGLNPPRACIDQASESLLHHPSGVMAQGNKPSGTETSTNHPQPPAKAATEILF